MRPITRQVARVGASEVAARSKSSTSATAAVAAAASTTTTTTTTKKGPQIDYYEPKFDLTLLGCGFLGYYHLGAICLLEQIWLGKPYNRICGASCGGLVGALLVSGLKLDYVLELAAALLRQLRAYFKRLLRSSSDRNNGPSAGAAAAQVRVARGGGQGTLAPRSDDAPQAGRRGLFERKLWPHWRSVASGGGGGSGFEADRANRSSSLLEAQQSRPVCLGHTKERRAKKLRRRAAGLEFLPTGRLIEEMLERMLPEDAHLRCNGRLGISVTRTSWPLATKFVSEFHSRRDLIQAVCAGCFIPFWSGSLRLPKFRGELCMDGAYSNNEPRFKLNTEQQQQQQQQQQRCLSKGLSEDEPDNGCSNEEVDDERGARASCARFNSTLSADAQTARHESEERQVEESWTQPSGLPTITTTMTTKEKGQKTTRLERQATGFSSQERFILGKTIRQLSLSPFCCRVDVSPEDEHSFKLFSYPIMGTTYTCNWNNIKRCWHAVLPNKLDSYKHYLISGHRQMKEYLFRNNMLRCRDCHQKMLQSEVIAAGSAPASTCMASGQPKDTCKRTDSRDATSKSCDSNELNKPKAACLHCLRLLEQVDSLKVPGEYLGLLDE